ncbi:hypothetical protein [Bartonella raoultii]|uniref:Toluene tolerance protein n=1 Tax=Bartonella raoultii TaxID=1457020 RepID=A0ABS7I5Y5_9HYPH|nr:hypothetical protein [Bartonella raoultii]MBX4336299.1 hypothetical protein [Bartonella raoultii]
MRSLFYFVLSLFLFFNIAKPTLAIEPMAIQKAELSRLIIDVNNAIKSRNFESLSIYMPDRLYKEMARRLNTTEDNLRDSLIKQIRVQFERFPSGTYHLDETNVEYQQTDKGSFYALIPTILEAKEHTVLYKTLAIFDENKWYLIYGGQKTVQNPVFLEIYPDFERVHLPKETIIKNNR